MVPFYASLARRIFLSPTLIRALKVSSSRLFCFLLSVPFLSGLIGFYSEWCVILFLLL